MVCSWKRADHSASSEDARIPKDNPTTEDDVNRSELIEAISGHTGLTTKESEAALAAVVYEITAGVRAGNPVRITGFGSFKLRQRAARRGRNPQTGAPVKVKASKGIGFTPGVRLKADLNSRTAPAKPSAKVAPAKKAAVAVGRPAKAAAKQVVKATAAKKSAPETKSAPVKKTVAAKTVAAKVAARTR